MKTLIALLGLSESADAASIEAAAVAKLEKQELLLTAERDARQAAAVALEQTQTELKRRDEVEQSAKVDALVERAKAEGRIIPRRDDLGAEVQTELELAVRRIAATGGLAAAVEFVDILPRVIPIGPPVPAAPPTEHRSAAAMQFDAGQLEVFKKMGLKVDDVVRFGLAKEEG